MEFDFKHGTTKDAAIRKIKEMLSSPERKEADKHLSDVREEWEGDTLNFAFTVQGQSISGTLTVTESDYRVYAKLPLMLRMFEGKIQREIEKQIQQMKS